MYGTEPRYYEPRYNEILVIRNTIQKHKREMYLDITNKCQHATKDEVVFCYLSFVTLFNLFITTTDDICQVPGSSMEDAILRMTNKEAIFMGRIFSLSVLIRNFSCTVASFCCLTFFIRHLTSPSLQWRTHFCE